VVYSADIRYVGQSHSLEIPFDDRTLTPEGLEKVISRFRERHEEIFGHKSMEDDVEFVNLRVVHSFPLPKPMVQRRTGNFTLGDAEKGGRKAYFREYEAFTEIPVYDRSRLPVNKEIEGPVIIEQADTTTVVYPNQTCQCNETNNLIIRVRRP
jgi:N-methylhydantoinase A